MNLLSLLFGADLSPLQTRPGFRGDGTRTSTAKNLPLTWSPTESLAWRTPLPKDELDATRYSTVGDVVYGGGGSGRRVRRPHRHRPHLRPQRGAVESNGG